MAGNIPASERTEYLPHIKLLCSITSAPNLSAIKLNALLFISVIIINLFLIKEFEKTIPRFVIVSRVFPDFEITTKQEFFMFLIFLHCACKSGSKLSKKNIFFLIFFF